MSDIDKLSEDVSGGAVDIEAIIRATLARVDVKLDLLKGEINEALDGLAKTVQDWFTGITREIRNWLATPLASIETAINLTIDTLQKWKQSVASIISSTLAEVQGWIESVVDGINNVIDDIVGDMSDIILIIRDAVDTFKKTIIATIELVIETVKNWLNTLWDTLIVGLKWLGNKILAGIEIIVNFVVDTFNDVYKFLKDSYLHLKEEITVVYNRSIERLKLVLDEIREELVETFTPMIEAFQDMWQYFKGILDEMKTVPEDTIAEVVYTLMKVQKKVLLRLIEEEGKG